MKTERSQIFASLLKPNTVPFSLSIFNSVPQIGKQNKQENHIDYTWHSFKNNYKKFQTRSSTLSQASRRNWPCTGPGASESRIEPSAGKVEDLHYPVQTTSLGFQTFHEDTYRKDTANKRSLSLKRDLRLWLPNRFSPTASFPPFYPCSQLPQTSSSPSPQLRTTPGLGQGKGDLLSLLSTHQRIW